MRTGQFWLGVAILLELIVDLAGVGVGIAFSDARVLLPGAMCRALAVIVLVCYGVRRRAWAWWILAVMEGMTAAMGLAVAAIVAGSRDVTWKAPLAVLAICGLYGAFAIAFASVARREPSAAGG